MPAYLLRRQKAFDPGNFPGRTPLRDHLRTVVGIGLGTLLGSVALILCTSGNHEAGPDIHIAGTESKAARKHVSGSSALGQIQLQPTERLRALAAGATSHGV